ncbi:MAG: hypothetical protein E7454_05585 [Ruminococcaceae bacterium]|nr:hypothetical protein [Oscillospiraceae bacterium]
MSTLLQNDPVAQKIAESNPELWRFFDGCKTYSQTLPVTCDARIFQDALVLARYLYTGETDLYSCTPGKMSTSVICEYRDHNGEDNFYSRTHSVTLIDEETYHMLRSKKDTPYNTEADLRTLHNFFYKNEDLFTEDFLITKAYYDHLEIVTRLKGIDGFFHFVFIH